MESKMIQQLQQIQDKIHSSNLHWWIDNDGNDIRKNPLTFSNKLLLIYNLSNLL